MTVVGGASVAMYALGVPGAPLFFIALGLILGIWVIGYAELARHVRSAGAQATFIARGLGRRAGVAATGVALVSYQAIYWCLYGLFGTVTGPVAAKWLHLDWPWWVWSLIGAVGVGLLGRTRIKAVGIVLTWLLSLELVVVLLVAASGFIHPHAGHYDWSDINPATVYRFGLFSCGGLAAYAVACVIGVEEVPGLAEDARNGKRDLRRALWTAVAVLAVLLTVTFLGMSLGEGPALITAVAADPNSGFPFDLLSAAFGRAGAPLADAAAILLVTSVFAALASFHTICARYLFAAGRDRILPTLLGRINPRNSSPSAASHTVSLLAVVVIAAFALTGSDPMAGLFAWGSYVAAVGVFALMAVSSIAVVRFFTRHPDLSPNLGVTFVAPVIAVVLMAGVWLLMLLSPQTMIGAGLFSPTHLVLLALPIAGLTACLLRGGQLRRDETAWQQVGSLTPVELAENIPTQTAPWQTPQQAPWPASPQGTHRGSQQGSPVAPQYPAQHTGQYPAQHAAQQTGDQPTAAYTRIQP